MEKEAGQIHDHEYLSHENSSKEIVSANDISELWFTVYNVSIRFKLSFISGILALKFRFTYATTISPGRDAFKCGKFSFNLQTDVD